MKKRLLLGILSVVMLSACFTGCGKKNGSKDMIYAVEAGSAGEAAAKEKDFKYNAVDSQANALMGLGINCVIPVSYTHLTLPTKA